MRLIDADALPKRKITIVTDDGYWTDVVSYKDDIDAAPTIDPVKHGIGCKYCQTDSDGFSLMLPRVGKGVAIIRKAPFDGWCIDISAPLRQGLKIPVSFCPFCGTKLGRVEDG